MAQLIVTADDFGYSTARDTGILQCWQKRSISRTSVLVNGVSAKEACLRAKDVSLPLGLHLNLTEGVPVSDTVRSLTVYDENSKKYVMRGKMGFRQALKEKQVNLKEIEREIESQIEKFITFTGSHPLYVDGHQHVHVLPGVCEILAELMVKYNIPETRVPEEIFDGCDWVDDERMKFYQDVSAQARDSRCIWIKHGIRFATAFIGMTTMGNDMSVERLKDRLKRALNKDNVSPISPEFPTVELQSSKSSASVQGGGHIETSATIVDHNKHPHENETKQDSANRIQNGGIPQGETQTETETECYASKLFICSNNHQPVVKPNDKCENQLQRSEATTHSAKEFLLQVDKKSDQCKNRLQGSETRVQSAKQILVNGRETASAKFMLSQISIELMTHPGYKCLLTEPGGCGTGPDEFALSEDREHEMSVLTSHSEALREVCEICERLPY